MTIERRETYYCAALLLLSWVFLHAGVLFGGQTFVHSDASSIFFPLWKWGGEAVAQGRLPLWCPDLAFGTPYLCDPLNLAWYFPKVLLYLWLPPVTAFNWLLGAHSLWAMAGFWAWGRGRGFSPRAVLLGAWTLGLSFNAAALFWSPCLLTSFAWSPWVFAASDRFWKGGALGWVLLSLALSLQGSAGHPLMGYLTVLALCFGKVLELAVRRTLPAGKDLLSFGGALAVAGLFNMAWLLPLKNMVPLSNLPLRTEMSSSLGWENLATFFDPFFLGHPLLGPSSNWEVRVFFLGLPPLVLVLGVILSGKVPGRPLALFLVLVLLGLGRTGGLALLLGPLPGYHWVVRSGYWIPLAVLAGAMLFTEVLEAFLRRREMAGRERGLALLAVLLVYGTALALGVPWDLGSFWASGLAMVLALGSRGRSYFLGAALLLSLVPVTRSVRYTLERSIYEQGPQALAALAPGARIYQPPDWVDRHRVLSAGSLGDLYRKFKGALVPNWPLAFGFSETTYSNTLFLRASLSWCYLPSLLPRAASSGVLDYLGAKYWVGFPSGEEMVRENPSAFPKWFPVERAVPEGDWPGDSAKISAPGFDLGRTCFVRDPRSAGRYSKRTLSIFPMGPNGLRLEAAGGGTAFLASSETAFPGWEAVVGGKRRGLEEVNHGFRGLRLGEDEREALITFRPVSFRLGLFLSLLACGFWTGIFLRDFGRRHA